MSDIQDFEDLDELLEPDDLIAALALSRATRATEVTDPAEPYSAATRYDHHTASPNGNSNRLTNTHLLRLPLLPLLLPLPIYFRSLLTCSLKLYSPSRSDGLKEDQKQPLFCV